MKKLFFKISQNSQQRPVPEETPVNSVKFLGTPFLQNNSGRLLLKCGHCKNEAREKHCLSCTEVDAMLTASAKTRHPAFMGICPTISQTC